VNVEYRFVPAPMGVAPEVNLKFEAGGTEEPVNTLPILGE